MTKRQQGRHRRGRMTGGETGTKPESAPRPAVPVDEDTDSGEERGWVDEGVRDYIAAIPADFRPLFDRFHRLIRRARPDAAVVLSYQMPSYLVGNRRLYLGVWQHGLSVYGWRRDEDDGFAGRHPELKTSTGTLRLSPTDAAAISDDEILGLVRATLGMPAG
jgi:hypothetical protein